MAKQFAFHQRVGQGGAVDADKSLVGAVGLGVQRLGHQFFAHTGFTRDEYRQITGRDGGNVALQGAHGCAVAQQASARPRGCDGESVRRAGVRCARFARAGAGGLRWRRWLKPGCRRLAACAAGRPRQNARVAAHPASAGPGLPVDLQHAAHAVVYRQWCAGMVGHQAVIRGRAGRCRWESAALGLPPAVRQSGGARQRENAGPGCRAQAIDRQGAQPVIARFLRARSAEARRHRREARRAARPAGGGSALSSGNRLDRLRHQGQQGVQQGGRCSHVDIVCCRYDCN